MIKGLLKREDGNHRNFKAPPAKYWWPTLFEGVVYSEILDKHMEIVCTKRGIRLVDECAGFDKYLLSTPVNEVYATGLMRIKREILLALADKERFTTKAGGKIGVYDKYEEWAVGQEEADWHGLSMDEAKKKQAVIESRQLEAEIVPDKVNYRKELVELLRTGQLDEMDMELAENELSDNGGFFWGYHESFQKMKMCLSDCLENGSSFCRQTLQCLEEPSLGIKNVSVGQLETKTQSTHSKRRNVL